MKIDTLAIEILRELRGERSLEWIARKIDVSRTQVHRWETGKNEPTLNQVLSILYFSRKYILMSFLENIVNIEKIHSLKKEYKKMSAELLLTYKHPEVGAILRCFELSSYLKLKKHTDGFVAKHTGISLDIEKKLLDEMKKKGVIELSGGKYKTLPHGVDTRGDFEGGNKIKEYWLQRGLQMLGPLQSFSEKYCFGHNVFSISEAGYKDIRELYMKFFEEVREVIEQDKEDPDRIYVLGIQLFSPSK